jgi:hypothetical protein
MMYFSEKAYSPKASKDIEQWPLVLKFRESFPPEGLWWPYKGPADFERKFRNHLTAFVLHLTDSVGKQPD